jgi:REP element-mobilizing transposase RayT
LLTAGRAVYLGLHQFLEANPSFSIIRSIIMPDHLHLVLFVKERLPKALGYYMASLKGACSRAVWTAMPELDLSRNRSPLFERGYNDRILFRDIQLDSFLHYVDDNPRRLLVRRRHRLLPSNNPLIPGSRSFSSRLR